MRRKTHEIDIDILEKQLAQAKRDLFKVGTIRQLKHIESRIRYLSERIKELSGDRK